MNRRDLIKLLVQNGVAFPSALFMIGCMTRRQDQGSSLSQSLSKHYVEMHDLFVLRLDGPSPGKPVDVLPAANIKTGKRTILEWIESDHGHYYEFGIEQYAKLKAGEVVMVESTEEEGHTHHFMVNPKVPHLGSESLRIPKQLYGDIAADAPLLPELLLSQLYLK
jgi:hypothetical protein